MLGVAIHPPLMAAKNVDVVRAFTALVRDEPPTSEVERIYGIKAFITKNVSTKQALRTERGRQAGKEEVKKVFGQPAFKIPIPLIGLSEEDIVYPLHLLCSIKHTERPEEEQLDKGRLIGLGHMLFNKWLRLRKDLEKGDYWVATSSLEDVRMVWARATAFRRLCEAIDLIVA